MVLLYYYMWSRYLFWSLWLELWENHTTKASKKASSCSWSAQNLINPTLEFHTLSVGLKSYTLQLDPNKIQFKFLDCYVNHKIAFCCKAHIKPAGHEDSGVVSRTNLKHL